jgi:hypothetical protein
MKTTIDIPSNELNDLISFTHAKTKKAAILLAIREFNRKNKMKRLSSMLGTFKDFMTQEELSTMRKDS